MLIEHIGEPAALEMLAEECTELAHAVLKLARVERGENPTPKSLEECYSAVIEEWADVILCMGELADLPWNKCDEFERIYTEKESRMEKRMESIHDKLRELPSASQSGWIPCEPETMPKEPFGCLVTVMDENPMTHELFENILPYFVGWDGEQWNDSDGEQCPFEVVAWKPLPEPYKPEE